MSGWTELAAGRAWTVTIGGVRTAQRQFLENAAGSDSVPAFGDFFPGSTTLMAQEWTTSYANGDPAHQLTTVKYGEASAIPQNPPPIALTTATLTADLPRKMSGAMTTEQIDNGTNAYWTGTSNPVNKPRYARIPTFTLTYSKIYTSWTTLYANVIPRLGKVSGSTWESQEGDHWMFVGCNAGEYRNSGGTLEILAEFSFECRSVTLASGTQYGGWNYSYNESTGAWEKATPLLYGTVDFSALFA